MTKVSVGNGVSVKGRRPSSIKVSKDGNLKGSQPEINFTGNVSVSNDPTNNKVDVEVLGGSGGSGDVTGPSSSTDGNITLFNGATGKIIKDSGRSFNNAIASDRGLDIKILSDSATENQTPRLILEEIQSTETGDFTLSADDAFKTKYLNSATPQNITFPDNTSVPIAIDTVIKFRRVGAGQYSFVAGGGVTINTSKGTMVDAGLDAEFQAVKTNTNEWYVDNGLPVSITSADVTGALGYTPSKEILLVKENTPVSHTGNTTETLLGSFLIPAGTMQADDILIIRARFAKTGTAGSYNGRLRYHSLNQVSGSTQIAIVSPGATQQYSYLKREITFVDSLISQEILLTTLNNPTDEITGTNLPSSIAIDFTVDQYLILTVNLNSAADTGILKGFRINIVRS